MRERNSGSTNSVYNRCLSGFMYEETEARGYLGCITPFDIEEKKVDKEFRSQCISCSCTTCTYQSFGPPQQR